MIKDNINNCELYFANHKNFEKAFDFIKKAVKENLPVGKYEIDGKEVYASVQEYNSKLDVDAKNEGHRNYIDVQYVVSGKEIIEVCDINSIQTKTEYNAEKDVEFYFNAENPTTCVLEKGEYAILFPHDIHRPGLAINGKQVPVKKIVVKVRR